MYQQKHQAIIIMGVSGAGKTTIGKLLSEKTAFPFFDADDFHSSENIEKMKAGVALTDADRSQWLSNLNDLLLKQLQNNSCILACSALKEAYRKVLSQHCERQVRFIHLTGTYEKILEQMRLRKGHFIPTTLLQSQFETLETPLNAYHLSINKSPEVITEEIYREIFERSEIGIVGLGVMGKSLCRNFANHGFRISMYNRHVDDKEVDIAKNFKAAFTELEEAQAFDDIPSFVQSLQHPRKILIMVNAGKPTDDVIASLTPYLTPNDILIDGGNTFFEDTARRQEALLQQKIHFIGCGISGGEEGALYGPSLMPSGNKEAYALIQPYLESIAAKDIHEQPCCAYIGEKGSGHFIKMVHNGIEYVEMQLLAEVYAILSAQRKTPDEIASILEVWKSRQADSYLLNITIDILREKENEDWLIHSIIDNAHSKGTGNWATIEITKRAIPATLIATALYARYISSCKHLRTSMSSLYPKNNAPGNDVPVEQLREAYELARIINHYQGFWLITEAFHQFGWKADLSEMARIWTNGCIIRSALMQELVTVFAEANSILTSPHFTGTIQRLKPSLSKVVATSIENEIAVPCFSEAINFLHGITTAQSAANLLQAQRDYFGAHRFQRYDAAEEQTFHHQWKKY
ncbi:MAG: NADP-dependent phosphogluconate dehydrogenase [Bacteroidota bacterium]|nr:NADP-dependent phosphogluconate dehydrogenase [Bacteroidota bacterium]